jgi:hypothetical protein
MEKQEKKKKKNFQLIFKKIKNIFADCLVGSRQRERQTHRCRFLCRLPVWQSAKSLPTDLCRLPGGKQSAKSSPTAFSLLPTAFGSRQRTCFP